MKYLFIVLLMQLTSNVFACTTIWAVTDKPNNNERKEYAEVIYARLIEIDKAIPSLKPDDMKWVENERNSGNIKRVEQALISKKYMIYETKNTLRYYIPIAKKLVDSDSENKRHEILIWAKIAGMFSHSYMWEDIARLKINGYVDIPKITDNEPQSYSFYCNTIANIINSNIVIAYLADELPD